MQSLLIISHGSRREASNNEIIRLEHELREELAESYPIVVSAFLEFSEQSIPEAIGHCIEKGATSIKVLPYFLAAGVHVTKDIPDEINTARLLYRSINVEILPHIGSSKSITGLIGNMLTTGNSHAI